MFSFPELAVEPPKPINIAIRPYTPIKYGEVAGESIAGDLPRDHFIHAIRIRVVLGTLSGGTSPAWKSDAAETIVKSLILKAGGTTYFKQGQWAEFKQICTQNLDKQSDGSLKLYFTDPKIPGAKPLPSWKFTSLVLQLEFEALTTVTTGSPTGQSGTQVRIVVEESVFDNTDIRNWPVLIEATRTKKTYGTDEEWQIYEHERANIIVGFVYHADDDGTDSDSIFDKLRIIGRKQHGQFPIYDEVELTDVREANKNAYQNQSLATGFFAIEFPGGLKTSEFTSLKSELYIDTAGTKAGIRVMERYLL